MLHKYVAPQNQIKSQIKAIQGRKATILNLITKSHVMYTSIVIITQAGVCVATPISSVIEISGALRGKLVIVSTIPFTFYNNNNFEPRAFFFEIQFQKNIMIFNLTIPGVGKEKE